MHPEFAEESSKAYKEKLLEEKNRLPVDIEEATASYKRSYNTVVIYGSIFGYLIIGAGVTAIISGVLTRRK
jgi:uncharacterized membrane protein YraQ (UPF0718 family)